MPDGNLSNDIEGGLEQALKTMEDIQRRLEAGEEIDERELTMLSRMVATQIEDVRAKLEAAVGPIDPEYMREEMRKQLSPEEFEEWEKSEAERKQFREEYAKEAPIREQIDRTEFDEGS